MFGDGGVIIGRPEAMPLEGVVQLAAIEAHGGVGPLGLAEQEVRDDRPRERALDRLLDAARRNRVDRRRGVAEADGVDGDQIVRQIGRRVDCLNGAGELRAAVVLHQTGAREKTAEPLFERASRRSERLRIDERQRVEDAARQRDAPEPGLLPGLDPRRLGPAGGAPIGENRERRRTCSSPGRSRAASACLREKVGLERLDSSVDVDREPPSPGRAVALNQPGGLADVDAEGAGLLDEGEIEKAAIDDETLLARVLAPPRPFGPIDADSAEAL